MINMRLLSLLFLFSLLHSKAISAENLLAVKLKTDYTNAINDFQNKSKLCEEGNEGLDKNHFPKDMLTNKDDLSIVINYFYFKSLYNCVKEELVNYSIQTTKVLAKNSNDEILKINYLIMNIPLSLDEARIEFNKLPNSTIEKVNKINRLEKPFDMLETIDNLNL